MSRSKPCLRWIISLLILSSWAFCAFAQGDDEWTTLESCRLVPSFLNDGDSFLVESEGRRYVVRLYFVDAPEVTPAYPGRVKEQAAYFGCAADEIPGIGRAASKHAERFLRGRFTVHTRFADGGGKKKRYLGIVERDGELLSQELVREGLARIHGYRPESAWPGGMSAERMLRELGRLETGAKSGAAGAWGERGATASASGNLDDRAEPAAEDGYPALPPLPGGEKIPLNHASSAELQQVPGIGAVYAGRIMAGRPWEALDELTRLKGVGLGKVTQWSPYLTVHPPRARIPQPETADFLREHAGRFTGQRMKVSILGITEMEWPAPDGFVVLLAHTGHATSSGGDIPLFVPEERLERAKDFFSGRRAGRSEAILHDYQGRPVLVIPRG